MAWAGNTDTNWITDPELGVLVNPAMETLNFWIVPILRGWMTCLGLLLFRRLKTLTTAGLTMAILLADWEEEDLV